MKCAHCGTEIADKALICYRCGEATTAPRVAPPAPPAERGIVPLLIALAVVLAAAVLVLPTLTPGGERVAGYVAVFVATFAVVRTLRPRRRRGLRR